LIHFHSLIIIAITPRAIAITDASQPLSADTAFADSFSPFALAFAFRHFQFILRALYFISREFSIFVFAAAFFYRPLKECAMPLNKLFSLF